MGFQPENCLKHDRQRHIASKMKFEIFYVEAQNRTWEVLLPNQKQGSVGRDESSWESQAGTINFKLCRRVYFSAFPPLSIVNIDTAYFFIAFYELIWHVVVSDFEKAFRFDYGWNLF